MNTATITQIKNNNLKPRTTLNGGLMPVVGTPVTTPYGDAVVVGYDNGSLKVEITDYNEDVSNVDEVVSGFAQARNRGFDCLIETIKRCSTETVTQIRERIENIEDRYYNDLQFRFQMSPNTELGLGTLYQIEQVLSLKESPSDERKRRRLEIAEAKRLADALLAEEESVPSDVQAELDEMFGEE